MEQEREGEEEEEEEESQESGGSGGGERHDISRLCELNNEVELRPINPSETKNFPHQLNSGCDIMSTNQKVGQGMEMKFWI